MVSVIVPLYNKQQYVAKTIQSVLDQTYADFEIVVVNDGSTDDSEKVVKTFQDPRIRLITIENSGVSVARNTGIEKAQYPWISFLDGDDWWDPNFLAEMVKAMEAFPKVNIFGAGRSRVFEDSIERYQHALLPKDGTSGITNYFEIIKKYLPPINASNAVFKASLFDANHRFRKGQRKHEDHDLWIRLCANEEVVFINKPLSFYLKNTAQSASQAVYDATDFCTYLTTLAEVKPKLTDQEQQWFSKYLNSFVPIVYLQNYKHYSRSEEKQVYKLAKRLVRGKHKALLTLLHAFPYKGMYGLLKRLKG
ncbi:glycosyltransferase family 2 protein [Aureisphaera galaxeae]|uniref:glycosyltransferase family 2 protein n=1 Tax=Aureisphaera galaxeae TaxID=1538023 RepID=UPI00234FEF60|nr:glycosyltransferase family 2 protein [Aureisphaera galaxeae]MDC8004592.1 glycosyltransferase family 2 protein [Aureisphaera galaxeae]